MTEVIKKDEKKDGSGVDISCSITYVILETVQNKFVKALAPISDNPKMPLKRGLFLGFTVEDSVFYITTKDGKEWELINAEKITVSLIEFGGANEKTVLIFGQDKADQDKAALLLSELLTKLQNSRMVTSDVNIVDFEKLRHYDLDRNTFGRKHKPVGFTDDGYDSWNKQQRRASATHEHTPYVREEIKVFERKSKMPTKARLASMKALVVAVMGNKGNSINTAKHNEPEAREAASVDAKATSKRTKAGFVPDGSAQHGTWECYGCQGMGEKPNGNPCLICRGSGRIQGQSAAAAMIDQDSDQFLRGVVAGGMGCPI